MPVVKGGVWTNAEDEVLKAAISKYGLNQWARVSSLLARKTAKQCKARWVEWLDPSIRKVEWSREEDEKLLHLAKIMPTQWRTIAPIVGRTANQCLERYTKLLDEAEAKESSELGLTGPDGETRPAEDVRRLRPGEVDPNPETKPARPDTIDLDEDEKEMLSEARARLINTKGKKAKRKERERQQEISKRMATLQKRRELKAAGINIKVITRKPGQMDYNADIPFEKKPEPGAYDTLEEIERNERQLEDFDPRKHQLASGKRKVDDGEDTDRKRRKNDDARSASVQDALKAGKEQRIREAEQLSRRRALNLPAPQVSEGELEDIVKLGRLGEEASNYARESENDATRGLVSSYNSINTNTPMRTPMAAPQEDHIANEIKNIRAREEAQSALLGGAEPEGEEGQSTTGYDGIAPRKQVISTPNPLATPLRKHPNGAGATPMRSGQTPMHTPRDSFALNSQDGASTVGSTPRENRMAELAMRNKLKAGLAALPKPKDVEFELMVPDEKPELAMTEEQLAEDAADRDRRERQIREAREELERRRRTQVIQKGLPRPGLVDMTKMLSLASGLPTAEHQMVAQEAVFLMANDAIEFPLPGSKVVGKTANIVRMDDEALSAARLEILVESGQSPSSSAVHGVFEGRDNNAMLLGLSGYESDDETPAATATRDTFEFVRDSIMSRAESDVKLEQKLAKHLGGYDKRSKGLRSKIVEAAEALRKASVALEGFKTLASSEDVAVQRRLESLREEVGVVSRREREAQEQYRVVKEELEGLQTGTNGVY